MLNLHYLLDKDQMDLPDYIDHGCNLTYSVYNDTCVIQKTEDMFMNRIGDDPFAFARQYKVVDVITILANKGDLVFISCNCPTINQELEELSELAKHNRHRVYSSDKAYEALDRYMHANFLESEYKERIMVLEKEGTNIHDLICASEMQGTIGERACLALIKRGLIGQDEVYEWEFDNSPVIDIPNWVNRGKKIKPLKKK